MVTGHFLEEMSSNAGIMLYTIVLMLVLAILPATVYDPSSKLFLLGLGSIAIWRYGWGLVNYIRALIYMKMVFPRWRRTVDDHADTLMPSKIYILVTSFRIKAGISAKVYHSIIHEAVQCQLPVTIVASIVEMQDEGLLTDIFNSYDLPDRISLNIVRVNGSGKRHGLAQGFRAISRDVPEHDAVCVVMDGDTVLLPGVLRKSVPFFKLFPNLGALTTDELAIVEGTRIMKEWHDLRFAQRHFLMSSISLSRRVMTLTGRMSIFKVDIVTSPDFIAHMQNDSMQHWRLGEVPFLTGDDKSSLYYVMKEEYEQIYLPDTQVITLEDPPSQDFVKASTVLMKRWFGNMLRTNARMIRLGPTKMPLFVWWAFVDQKLSLWTTLTGPLFAGMLTVHYGGIFFLYYFACVATVRLVMTLSLLAGRRHVSGLYPFLLYYNQIYAALVKLWVLFRLDSQAWTRQKTTLQSDGDKWRHQWNSWTSHICHTVSLLLLVCAIGYAGSVFTFPEAFLRNILP